METSETLLWMTATYVFGYSLMTLCLWIGWWRKQPHYTLADVLFKNIPDIDPPRDYYSTPSRFRWIPLLNVILVFMMPVVWIVEFNNPMKSKVMTTETPKEVSIKKHYSQCRTNEERLEVPEIPSNENEKVKENLFKHSLMLSDWVCIHTRNRVMVPLSDNEITSELHETFKNVKLDYITKWKIGYDEWSDLFQNYILQTVDYDQVEPVSLTEDIISLNGILPLNGYNDGDTHIEYVFYDGFNFHIETKGRTLDTVVWNVHELQNALRQCGLNEWADNFIIEVNNQ